MIVAVVTAAVVLLFAYGRVRRHWPAVCRPEWWKAQSDGACAEGAGIQNDVNAGIPVNNKECETGKQERIMREQHLAGIGRFYIVWRGDMNIPPA